MRWFSPAACSCHLPSLWKGAASSAACWTSAACRSVCCASRDIGWKSCPSHSLTLISSILSPPWPALAVMCPRSHSLFPALPSTSAPFTSSCPLPHHSLSSARERERKSDVRHCLHPSCVYTHTHLIRAKNKPLLVAVWVWGRGGKTRCEWWREEGRKFG